MCAKPWLLYDADWQIQQRVVRLMLLAKSLTGEEVARQLIMCLSNELSVSSNQLVAAMVIVLQSTM